MTKSFKYIIWLIVTFVASIFAIPSMLIAFVTGYFSKQMFNLIECVRAYFKLKEYDFKYTEDDEF